MSSLEAPISRSYDPGSSRHPPRATSQNSKADSGTWKSSSARSPGARVTRRCATSSRRGRGTDGSAARVYSCATSSAVTSPVLVTVNSTCTASGSARAVRSPYVKDA